MDILLYVAIFILGFVVGYSILEILRIRRFKYIGTIYVTEDDEKTMYSLELLEHPESMLTMKEVVFKVNASEEDRN